MAMLFFIVLSLFSAIAWHSKVKKFWLATIGATVSTVVIFQVAAYLNLGYLDPFFLIAVATSSLMAIVIALIVGAMFLWESSEP